MSAQSVASRSRQPNRSAPDDVVLARALEFSNWARANIRIIVSVAVIAAVAIGALLVYRTQQADREQRAAAEFMQLEATMQSGNAALATRDLQGFMNRYDGTEYAKEARLLLARVHLQEGKAADAVRVLGPVSGEAESPLGAQATLLRAAAQQAAGQREAAIASYLQVADQAELGYLQQDALASAAALRVEASDFAGAAELYRRLIETVEEGSLQRSVYEMRLAEAEAQAQAATR